LKPYEKLFQIHKPKIAIAILLHLSCNKDGITIQTVKSTVDYIIVRQEDKAKVRNVKVILL